MIRYLFFILLFFIACEKKTVIHNAPEADKLYDEGTSLLLKDNIEAYKKFQEALNYYYKTRDSSNISKSLICQAIAQKYTGDIFGAEATLVDALTFMKEGDESLYSAYSTLGDIKYAQKEYSSAEEWYAKGLSEKNTSEKDKFDMLNNKGAAEYRQKKYSEALKTLRSIDPKNVNDINLKNRIKENIVYTQWLQDKNYPAQSEFEELLKLKLKNNDNWGANSSYSHLAEINQDSNPNISLYYAHQMLNTAEKIKSPDDRLEAIEKISLVDNPSNAIKNFKQYKHLSDSIQSYKNDNRNRFAYIKYDGEKKEIENQRLKAEKVEKEFQLLWQYFLSGLLVALIIIIIILYKKRQKKLQQEKEIEVKNTQLKMSKKVHDVVANGLYHMMIDVQNNPEMDKTRILNDIEKMYEESRDISHENIAEKDFALRFINMITSYSSDEQKVLPLGYKENIWESIAYNTQLELYYTLREILVNMKKHSQAKLASVRFEKDNYNLKIKYTDNGIGINNLDQKKGTGIHNTENRIENIGGDITFEKNPTGGLIVQITIPIQSKYV
ncbi:signal transduction histidine kinase [Chryseobacterium vietnamense]|uniref:Signal transduction histidine kinase n=1 Tax=Chryseobacterium vietnamense TaxID=866785 RepID=A0ACC6JEQ6_9FLAO|nr:ATP-binding protein [Chryseobacterium vietnamense]MDR6461243.1 signal transduction histidine kinase [Chryseobacterium vietnamense]